jgi:hypothetical protein
VKRHADSENQELICLHAVELLLVFSHNQSYCKRPMAGQDHSGTIAVAETANMPVDFSSGYG